MPRTPIPEHLIHRPEEVERNAQRFDQLCRLAEEVALPVVKHALIREAATTGAHALADEAKAALDGLVEEAVRASVEDPAVIQQVRQSLEAQIPEPDEEEWRALTRDTAQVLMSVWLETLRGTLSKPSLVLLSDYLFPTTSPNFMRRLLYFFETGPDVPRPVAESMASFPMTETETGVILSKFREKLFSKPRRIDLPFDLVIAGAPEMQAVAMHRSTYDALATRLKEHVSEPSESRGSVTADAQLEMTGLAATMTQDAYQRLLQQATHG